jgi:hypothetical protein
MSDEPGLPAFALDIKAFQRHKRKQRICGDTFVFRRLREEKRSIAVLSDGLGSGIKANVLSALTATMALRFTAGFRDLQKTAEIIMETLPVCSVRKISYATFCIIDIDALGDVRLINYDSPAPILIRNGVPVAIESSSISGRNAEREYQLSYSKFPLSFNDRIVFFTDGVTQAGIGSTMYPMGWGVSEPARFAAGIVTATADCPARTLARRIVQEAYSIDAGSAGDDMTCAVIHYRKPRELLIASGPPVLPQNDVAYVKAVDSFAGRKIICGGTTSKIVARELGRSITINLSDLNPVLPPQSSIDGIDLVTEGIITLHALAKLLESPKDLDDIKPSPAKSILERMLESDIVHFLIGTRINAAWQDPSIPAEMGLRRTIISQIVTSLERRHQKETKLRYL